MTERKEREEPRRDLLLILLIVPLGVLCMFLTGQQAIKLVPSWTLVADMGSSLDPDVDFAAKTNPELMEPVNPNILTQPVWGDLFLTPNAIIPTRIIIIPTKVPTLQPQPTTIIPTDNPTPVPPPTAIVLPPPPPPTSPPPPPPPPPPPVPSADLGITKDDGNGVYTPGAGIRYTLLVNNAGPDAADGFNITDSVPAAITGLAITCTPSDAVNDSCGANNTSGQNVAFNGASLSVGETITVTIQGVVDPGTTGDLSNTTNLVIPGGAGFNDSDTTNNSAIDTNTQSAGPNFGPPDGGYFSPGDGVPVTYLLPTPITADGNDTTYDFVYFEYMFAPDQVLMDWVQVEISTDGFTWFTVFFWGDGIPDTNTNVDTNNPAVPPPEIDNYAFNPASAILYASPSAPTIYSGVTIDIDAITGSPAGTTYPWIRITAPEIPPGSGDYGDGDGLTLDSIQPYYP
ncbi:MAG: DUF11 domain-containing protein [Anaerolineales bacterium]|nr:DUF11 domain-containing protein [Anaerolineales bacterium]